MQGKILHYYINGNTAKGFYSLYDSALEGLNQLFILKGGPETVKTTFIKSIGETVVSKGINIEYLHCSADNDLMDGIIIPQFQVGIVNGATLQVSEGNVSETIKKYVELENVWDAEKLFTQKEEILQLKDALSRKFQTAYDTFAATLRAHDDIEEIYISNMDFSEADKLTNELIALFYGDDIVNKESKVKDRFLGAATPEGAVDFIQNLTGDINKRYFVKGRAGSGKSTMLKKIAAAGKERGFDVEIYHCGFDPNSLDMVIIREQNIAIFDSTAPHEYFPDRETDEIIDMYERCITPGTDEKFAREVEKTTKAYKDKMKEAISYLAETKVLHDKLEALYIGMTDFSKVEQMQQELVTEIESIIER